LFKEEMDFCCFDEEKVRNNRKGKSQAFHYKLGFFDTYGFVAS
jgi:hypothetical protein